ncbi:uncharacterized protein LOC126291437 [Schistocerca gregaria]|uniref:uncharacterized protein LOC126291437 n=1 Tax=Schistocerca gregaria TaxID=7010 RepID=UPI00211E0C73|nr:uncharacterized protein LOC126291437 [Schistocerca gregaria]
MPSPLAEPAPPAAKTSPAAAPPTVARRCLRRARPAAIATGRTSAARRNTSPAAARPTVARRCLRRARPAAIATGRARAARRQHIPSCRAAHRRLPLSPTRQTCRHRHWPSQSRPPPTHSQLPRSPPSLAAVSDAPDLPPSPLAEPEPPAPTHSQLPRRPPSLAAVSDTPDPPPSPLAEPAPPTVARRCLLRSRPAAINTGRARAARRQHSPSCRAAHRRPPLSPSQQACRHRHWPSQSRLPPTHSQLSRLPPSLAAVSDAPDLPPSPLAGPAPPPANTVPAAPPQTVARRCLRHARPAAIASGRASAVHRRPPLSPSQQACRHRHWPSQSLPLPTHSQLPRRPPSLAAVSDAPDLPPPPLAEPAPPAKTHPQLPPGLPSPAAVSDAPDLPPSPLAEPEPPAANTFPAATPPTFARRCLRRARPAAIATGRSAPPAATHPQLPRGLPSPAAVSFAAGLPPSPLAEAEQPAANTVPAAAPQTVARRCLRHARPAAIASGRASAAHRRPPLSPSQQACRHRHWPSQSSPPPTQSQLPRRKPSLAAVSDTPDLPPSPLAEPAPPAATHPQLPRGLPSPAAVSDAPDLPPSPLAEPEPPAANTFPAAAPPTVARRCLRRARPAAIATGRDRAAGANTFPAAAPPTVARRCLRHARPVAIASGRASAAHRRPPLSPSQQACRHRHWPSQSSPPPTQSQLPRPKPSLAAVSDTPDQPPSPLAEPAPPTVARRCLLRSRNAAIATGRARAARRQHIQSCRAAHRRSPLSPTRQT